MKNNTVGRSALVLALATGLALTGPLPTSRAAGADYQPYGSASLLTVGSHQYYDVYGTQPRDISEPSLFLRQVLEAPVPQGYQDSLADRWSQLGKAIHLATAGGRTRVGNVTRGENLGNGKSNWRSTGLIEASSLAAADQQLRDYVGVGTHASNSDLSESTVSQTVFYQFASANNTTSDDTTAFRAGYAVIFYGFTLGYLNAGDQMTQAAPGPDNQVTTGTPDVSYAGGVQNQSSVPVTATQSLAQSTAQALQNTVTNTKQYTFGETIEYSTELTTPLKDIIGGGKETLKLAFNAQQMFATATASSTTTTTTTTATGQVALALPAHTGALLSQATTRSTFVAKYDYPVAVQYKVKVVAYSSTLNMFSGDPLSHYEWSDQTLTTFGDNPAGVGFAADNLEARRVNRGIAGYETSHGSGLDWIAVDDTAHAATTDLSLWFGDTSSFHYDWALMSLITHRPMSLTGGVLTGTSTTIASNVTGIAPLYPLARVTTTQQRPLTMTVGDVLYTGDLPLAGVDRYNVGYYGFNPDLGHWVVVNSAGTPVPTSSVAQLGTNALTGVTTLQAGQTPGTVYLKYLINDGVYRSGDMTGPGTTNANLVGTAVIPVVVNAKPFAGSITVRGKLTGYVGDPALTITGRLVPTVSDPTGQQVSRPVVWEQQELSSLGVQVAANKISFTRTGTFHVRAVVDGVRSPWIAVTALPKRHLASITIADPMHLLTTQLRKGGSYRVDLSRLTVVGRDQYGARFALPTKVWAASGGRAISVRGSVATVTAPGTYSIAVTSGRVRSNVLKVSATLMRHVVTFDSRGGTRFRSITVYDGTLVNLAGRRPVRRGYVFLGWYSDKALKHRVHRFNATSNVTLYASWYRLP